MKDIKVINEDVMVVLEDIGEGYNGDYDEEDPSDEHLVRFTIYKGDEQVDDASYCTTISTSTPRKDLTKVAKTIMNEVFPSIKSGKSVKKLCERLSHITA